MPARVVSVVEQRFKAVLEVIDAGASVTDVARRYGVDRSTLHRWLVEGSLNWASTIVDELAGIRRLLLDYDFVVMNLVGREEELETALGWIEQALSGQVSTLVLEGEAGIGKTALLEECAAAAGARQLTILRGRCLSFEHEGTFAPLVEAFGAHSGTRDGVSGSLTGRFPGGEHEIRESQQQEIVNGFVELVEATARLGPMLLALEDLHWSDSGTITVLRSIHRRIVGLPVALLWTMRPAPRTRELDALIDEAVAQGGTIVSLGPLSENEAVRLAESQLGTGIGPGLRAQIAGASGNPLFLTELIGALSREGVIAHNDDLADVSDVTLPPSLRLTILRRMSFLQDETLEMLRLAALLGTIFEPRDLPPVLDRPMTGLLPALDEARRAGVLVEDEAGILRFRHELLRDALYDEIPEGVRVELHREMAERLAQAGAAPTTVTAQYALGARPGDRDAAVWLHRAGARASERVPTAGIDLLERSLEVCPKDDPLRNEILADLVHPFFNARRFDEALAAARSAIDGPLPAGRELSVRNAIVSLILDHVGTSEEAINEAEHALTVPGTDEDRVQILGSLAFALSMQGDVDGAGARAAQAMAIAKRSGDHKVLSSAIMVKAWTTLDPKTALEVGQEAVAITRKVLTSNPSPVIERELATRLASYSWLALYADQFDECERALSEARPVLEGLPGQLGYFRSVIYKRYLAGEWEECIADVEGLSTAIGWEGHHSRPIVKGAPTGAITSRYLLMLHHRDEPLAPAIARLRRDGEQPRIAWLEALRLARTNPRAASEILDLEWKGIDRSAIRDAIMVAMDAGRDDLASAWAGEVLEGKLDSSKARARHMRGLAEGDVDALVESVALYRNTPHRLGRAWASADAAVALARSGMVSDARPLFAEAMASFSSMGARRDARWMAAAMRSFGLQVPKGARRSRALTGWEAVTPAEMAVVRLVAEGLSNPEIAAQLFLSRYTVETHIKHVFAKTGVISRAQMSAEFARLTDT